MHMCINVYICKVTLHNHTPLLTMKRVFNLFLFIIPFFSFSQKIELEKYGILLQTNLLKIDREYADSVFNTLEIKIALIKLLPHCNDEGKCYPESIINDDFNWNTHISESDFGVLYFRRVNYQYIDSTSLTEIDPSDYAFFLTKLLEGPRKLEDNEVINMCYIPRHAVLFINSLDEIIAIQEICFECGHTKVAISTTDMRHQSSSAFVQMFRKYKLKA